MPDMIQLAPDERTVGRVSKNIGGYIPANTIFGLDFCKEKKSNRDGCLSHFSMRLLFYA